VCFFLISVSTLPTAITGFSETTTKPTSRTVPDRRKNQEFFILLIFSEGYQPVKGSELKIRGLID